MENNGPELDQLLNDTSAFFLNSMTDFVSNMKNSEKNKKINDQISDSINSWVSFISNHTNSQGSKNDSKEEEQTLNVNIEKLMDIGLKSISDMHTQILNSANTFQETVEKNKFVSFDKKIFNIVNDIYESEMSKLFSIPQVGLGREFQEKFFSTLDKYHIFKSKLTEFIYFLSVPIKESIVTMPFDVELLLKGDPFSEEHRLNYQKWLKVLESKYMDLFKSSEYCSIMSKAINSLIDFNSAKKEIIQDVLIFAGFPVVKDMDELYKDIYIMKKRITYLEKKLDQKS